MFPKWHIFFGLIFSLILYFIFNMDLFNSLIVFLASVLIDFDHYIWYTNRKKDWNLKRAYKWNTYLERKHEKAMHIFHTIEFLILIFILSFFLRIFFYILIGILFHSILDFIGMICFDALDCRELSLIRYLSTKNKNKYF